MKVNYPKYAIVFLFIVFCSSFGLTQSKNDGWESGSEFNNLFNTKTIDTLSGEIVSIDSVQPGKGMCFGIQVVVKTKTETATVILCPTWFTQCLNICLKANDKIEIEGSRVVYNGKPIIIAQKIISNRIILQMRNSKGVPIWDYLRRG